MMEGGTHTVREGESLPDLGVGEGSGMLSQRGDDLEEEFKWPV